MLQEFCPDCGTRRVALFRWCRKCGLDYDELDARGDLPRGPYATADRGGGHGNRRNVGRAADVRTARPGDHLGDDPGGDRPDGDAADP